VSHKTVIAIGTTPGTTVGTTVYLFVSIFENFSVEVLTVTAGFEKN